MRPNNAVRRWTYRLLISTTLLSACNVRSSDSAERTTSMSSGDLQQALFDGNEPDRCVQEAYNWLISAHSFGQDFHDRTNTILGMESEDLYSPDRDRRRDALEVVSQQQGEVSREYDADLSSAKINAQFRCSELHSHYAALAERLNDYPQLQAAVRSCSDIAARLVKMTAGDGSEKIDEDDLRQCPEGIAAAAESAGLALPRVFAERWSASSNPRIIHNSSSGPHLTQAMLRGAWAYGGNHCAVSGAKVRIDEVGEADAANVHMTVLPNGDLQTSSSAGIHTTSVRVIDHDHFTVLDPSSGYEIPWERCTSAEAASAPTAASQEQQQRPAVLGSIVLPALGQCFSTAVKQIGPRLEGDNEGSSGTFVSYQDGHTQVDYETVASALGFNVDDPVKLCVVSLPKNCPPGDNRGVNYKATDVTTGRTWTAADSEHACGGA